MWDDSRCDSMCDSVRREWYTAFFGVYTYLCNVITKSIRLTKIVYNHQNFLAYV